jgi:small subunit ribosomal protein S8
MMTDPIADLLTRIRNAGLARLDRVEVPLSKIKLVVAQILKSEGYVADCRVSDGTPSKLLTVFLKYSDRQHVIDGLRRISRPGRRVYVKATGIPRVRDGLGISLLSTPQGVMSDREARKKHLGGEILCQVW